MAFIDNLGGPFLLTFGDVPFCLDQAKVVRMGVAGRSEEDPPISEPESQRYPRKYQPEADLIDEIDRFLPFMYLQDFGRTPDFPGRNISALALRDKNDFPNPQIRIGDWYYPTGACRWSVFRGLASSTQVKLMLQETTGRSPAFLNMRAVPNPFDVGASAAPYTLASLMYMLPPRPLAEHGNQYDGLFLVTLVDERYYWSNLPVSLLGFGDRTWGALLDRIQAVLGVSIDYDPIPSIYTFPEYDSQLWTSQESAAALLDAIAANIGCVVVRRLDGTYRLMSARESEALVLSNRGLPTSLVRVAGGDSYHSNTPPSKAGDLRSGFNTVVPDVIQVSFPEYVDNDDPVPHYFNPRYQTPRATSWYEESYGDVFTVDVPILSGNGLPFVSGTGEFISGITVVPNSGNISGLTGLLGVANLPYGIRTTAKALRSGEANTTPVNVSGLTAMAMQLAADYYSWQLAGGLDEVYPGTYNWEPEGVHDIIWTYSARVRGALTRVMTTQWNQCIKEFQHLAAPMSGTAYSGQPQYTKGCGGPQVAQTIRDSYGTSGTLVGTSGLQGQIGAVLRAPFLSGDSSVVLDRVSFLPTYNRWKGRITASGISGVMDEIVLFEGTSGGVAGGGGFSVRPTFRGIDGTPIASGFPSGSILTQVLPDTTYGVNLTSYEMNQFVYPSDYRSGGIAGVNVVPQVQSVQVADASPVLLNNIFHYSGMISRYDPSKVSGGPWKEIIPIWIVPRSAALHASSGLTTSGVPVAASGEFFSGEILSGQVEPLLYSGQRFAGTLAGYSMSGPVRPVYVVDVPKSVGLVVTAGTSGQISGCSCPEVFYDCAPNADGLRFNACDFTVSDYSDSVCSINQGKHVALNGGTESVIVLGADCCCIELCFRNGLFTFSRNVSGCPQSGCVG